MSKARSKVVVLLGALGVSLLGGLAAPAVAYADRGTRSGQALSTRCVITPAISTTQSGRSPIRSAR